MKRKTHFYISFWTHVSPDKIPSPDVWELWKTGVKFFRKFRFETTWLHLKMTACGEARMMVSSQAPSTINLGETTWTGFSNLDPPGRLSDQLSRELNKMPIQVFSQSGTLEERSCTGFSIPPEWISKSLHIWLAWLESLKTFETDNSNKLWIESFAFIQESLQKVISPDLINKYDKHVLWNFSKILSLKIINSLRQGHQWWEQ